MATKPKRWLKNHLKHLPRAFLANVFFGWPSRRLKIIGVTGTDGKTTTTLILHHFLAAANLTAGYISTIAAQAGDLKEPTGLHVTSPAPRLLQRWLKIMAAKMPGGWVVLETTSHGLDQYRFFGIHFDVGIFTNLTREHLDYHRSMDNYLKAKMKLLRKAKMVILNKDDEYYPVIKKQLAGKKIVTYGLKNKADWSVGKVQLELGRTVFYLTHKEKVVGKFVSRLSGRFNLYNQSAALAAVLENKLLTLKQAQTSLATFSPPLGRLDLVISEPYKVMIDFAHTPNALEQLLKTLRQLHKGRLVVVFGAAGERDRGKRALMGEVAGRLADVAVLTSEDPRRENPKAIIKEISQGCRKAGMRLAGQKKASLAKKGKLTKVFFRIENRQQAINFTLRKLARHGDLIVLCGKGHEQSICYGQREYPWSEYQAVKVAANLAK